MNQQPTLAALEELSEIDVGYIVRYASQAFRKSADKDYISARAVYKLECSQQFLWLAEQAVEKYLKAILLYNLISTRSINHDLKKALRKVKNISDLPIVQRQSRRDTDDSYNSLLI